ncbi:hypothetical protein [Nocardiopsis sp. MG754419]|uniref:hypothetical protein n=1 Tax=Nocardiopsis sp. MG754419 TaxID=2259865 RepID=UPI001BA7C3B7|nr:hypothetical protein [Nocardiopsis sp. MG754419]
MSDSTPRASTAPLGGRFWAFWSAAPASDLRDGVAMIAVPWHPTTRRWSPWGRPPDGFRGCRWPCRRGSSWTGCPG